MKRKLTLLLLLVFPGLLTYAQTVDFNYSSSNGLYCNPQIVNFTQNCSPAPTSFTWNFGNGQTGTGPTPSTTYVGAGTYSVKLTAIYPGRAISTTKTIVINPTPNITLSADRNNLCQPGVVVFSVSGGLPGTNYEWNFGDGSPITSTTNSSMSHTYSSYNNFTATVKATTAAGCINTSSYSISIAKFPITGSVTPPEGCIPSNSVLSATANLPAGDATQNFLWDFGDGSPTVNTATNSVNHVYNSTSLITTANVIITSSQGCTNQYTFSPIAFGTPPFATDARTVSGRSTFCGSETIQLFGKATNANKYFWDFGDGTNATITDTLVTHRYRSLGNKRIILTPYFNGCAGTRDTIDVFIEGVIADYSLSNTCGNKNTYAFTNLSLGNIDHFEWTFSDTPLAIDSTNYNINHTFPPVGVFSAKLLLIDSITGCRDSLTRPIITAQPAITSSTAQVCKDSLIVYRVLNSYPPGYGYTYEYHVNGVVLDNGANTDLAYNPVVRGDFTDYVIIKDSISGTCNDTLYLPNQTRVRGPVAGIQAASRICSDSALVITNTTYPFFAGDTVTTWAWDFGDNTTDSVQHPAPHSFPSVAIFGITLTATDVNGCSNTTQHYVQIAQLPSISVFPKIDTLCQGSIATLTAVSTDSLSWTPITNIDCIDCDTVNVNPPVTTLYIATAITSYGCKNTDSSLVMVFAPINLVVSPSDTIICPGKTIQYNTNASGAILWSPSTYLNNDKISNPIAKPTAAITYMVTAKDSVGCFVDSAYAVVSMLAVPTVDAGPDQVLPYYSPFNISPAYSSDVTNYIWSPSMDLSCTNCPAPSGIATASRSYAIEVTNTMGCVASDTIRIVINCLNSNLLMPTAFTPNNDGKNDYFFPISRGYRTVRHFVIFNRYGNKVFERRNFDPNIPSLGWDGRVRGNVNGNEVFSWFMEAECDLGELMNTKGTVVLIR